MEITRRNLLGAGAAVGAGLLLPLNLRTVANAAKPIPNVLGPFVTPFSEPLPTLAELGVIDATGGGAFAISMKDATHYFHTRQANATPTFAYQGGDPDLGNTSQTYLGPVIIAKKNVPFDLTMTNNLGAHPVANAIDIGIMGTVTDDARAPRTAVHLHGGNTNPVNDGDPMDWFPNPASTPFSANKYTYQYENTQEAAGLWYHDHAIGITRLNVYAGLAGGYLVRDDNDPGDSTSRLPIPPYEVPLIIQDRMFNADGTLNYPLNPTFASTNPPGRKWAPEFFGDVATVNGKIQPRLDVKQGKYRFRMVNGSNARFYNFKLKSSLGTTLTFFQIGTDGGLLNTPVPLTKLLLAPGERADVVVDFAGLPLNTTIILANDAVTPFPNGPRKLKKGGMPLPQIMQFKVVATVTGDAPLFTAALPTQLRATPVTPLAGLVPKVVRDMTLVEILDPVLGPLMALMNNRSFDHTMHHPMTPKTDTLEQWNLINLTGDAHPMHLHFTQFQILNRQKFDAVAYGTAVYGAAPLTVDGVDKGLTPIPVDPALLTGPAKKPAANEAGWKDTVIAMPGEVTRILVPFGANIPLAKGPMAIGASHLGKYVSHCHILEHEENDMMMRFEIIGPTPPAL